MHIIGEGCPGVTSIMVKLAAHLSDFNTCQINSSLNVMNHGNQMDLFKAELVCAYTRAGVKVINVNSSPTANNASQIIVLQCNIPGISSDIRK